MSKVRKKKISTAAQTSAKKKLKTVDLGWKNDEHIDSDDDEEEEERKHRTGESFHDEDDVEEEEALDAKKVRLARQYLQKLDGGDSDDSSSEDASSDERSGQEDDDYDRLGTKLQRERLKREGALERVIADKVAASLNSLQKSLQKAKAGSARAQDEARQWIDAGHVRLLRGHELTPTCVALQRSGHTAISASKDHSVLLWDVENEKKSHILCPQWNKNSEVQVSRTRGEVLSVACSDDGRYAAVGRRDATVTIFDIRVGKQSLVQTFKGHKGPVTCLAFRTQSLQLFSGSDDRCIR